MNLQYLGDALDHWKGSVFETLIRKGLLRGFRVDAMASDARDWNLQDRRLFAGLLRIKEEQIVGHRSSLTTHRDQYFREIPSEGDLFLDPDTGIATGEGRDAKHLRPDELFRVMQANRQRVVIVYQHVRGQKTRARIEQVMGRLLKERVRFWCTSYESSTVALLFSACERKRVSEVRRCFEALLGSHAESRVGFWPN